MPGGWDAPITEAHPRSRGENFRRRRTRRGRPGSSPLTRGKRGSRDHRPDARGLIPAHAGKTSMVSARPPPSGAHPRSRGENHEGTEIVGFIVGSSPLTRGKPDPSLPRPHAPGLIPAHAGKTPVHAPTMSAHRAHPRSRGENQDGAGSALIRWGSSPLTRGKPHRTTQRGSRGRLIPAHTGKTRQ